MQLFDENTKYLLMHLQSNSDDELEKDFKSDDDIIEKKNNSNRGFKKAST